jgi:DNA (cytosine-5)-methyltransferase 1
MYRKNFSHGKRKPIAIDLFCGWAELTVGLEKAGFHVLGAADIDYLFIKTYKGDHGGTTAWEAVVHALNPCDLLRELKN